LAKVNAQAHADVDTLTAKVRSRLGSVSTRTVYDVLRALAGAELIRRIESEGSPARFEARVGDNHHHVVCRVSSVQRRDRHRLRNRLVPVPTSAQCQRLLIDEAEVTYWSICTACQQDA